MKQTIRLDENELNHLIMESVVDTIIEIKEKNRISFPLDERINMESYHGCEHVVSINETNAKRMIGRHGENGYIIISPCRGCDDFGIDKTNDPEWKTKLKQANAPRIKDFVNCLKNTNFSYTPVYGGFIENLGKSNQDNVYERSFMVYAMDKTGKPSDIKDLYNFGLEMARRYNQDSFLFKEPGENPKYIKQDEEVDMEFGPDAAFNDFAQEYFTDLHKNSEKHSDKENGRPTRFTFLEAYVNPSSTNMSARAPRYYKGEIFI